MDLSDISMIEEVPMVLIDPNTGEELEGEKGKLMTIWLVGKDSKKFEEYKAEMFSQVQKSKKKFVSYGEAKRRGIDLLVNCTVRFENIIMGGKELEYSDKAAKNLYKSYPWIKEQVDEFIGDRSNFLSRGAKE